MDVQTNGHAKRTTRKAARKTSGAVAKVKSVAMKAERKAEHLVHEAETAVNKSEAGSFIRRNPKTAVGVALGAGLFVGAIANRRYLRASTLALAAYLGKRFF
jgi:ElaB/YqjD/DUF883 family membrane-anchored ribosome-binding protein